ncbi:MAG: hypothetical protein KME17_28390 [Cyanosarcina radialis HA8281-LM2]|nr:hypothetical protein [Cyanosarcina radialis HA8281-LM2]
MSSYFCPICQNILLHHANHKHVYWFCSACRQEVPLLGENQLAVTLRSSDRLGGRLQAQSLTS